MDAIIRIDSWELINLKDEEKQLSSLNFERWKVDKLIKS